MGVKGLNKSIKSIEHLLIKEIINDCYLLIDGNGWLFYFIQLIKNNIYGGNYKILDNIIKNEIKYLKEIRKLNILVYFDGDNTILKEDTKIKRRYEIEEKWKKLENYCCNNNINNNINSNINSKSNHHNKVGNTIDENDIPKAVFSKTQFINTLKELNVDIIITQNEADQEMSLYCYNLLSNGFPCYCYADDSDFAVMKGVPLIQFSELSSKVFYENLSKNSDSNSDSNSNSNSDSDDEFSLFAVKVLRRSTLSQLFGLTESQFVEWCILSGNDFTGHFSISDFNDDLDLLLSSDSNKIKGRCTEAKRIIKTKGQNFCLSSNDPKLQLAINFSRDFYELRDLSNYPIDQINHEPLSVSLTKDDITLITCWIDRHETSFYSLKIEDIGLISLNILRSLFYESESYFQDETYFGNLLNFISPIYLNVLEQMLDKLKDPSNFNLLEDYQFKHPNWNDLMFTRCYQLVCQQILKLSEKLIFGNQNKDEIYKFKPFQIFNEQLFYSILDEELMRVSLEQLSLNNNSTQSNIKTAPNSNKKQKNLNKKDKLTKLQSPSQSQLQSPSQLQLESQSESSNSLIPVSVKTKRSTPKKQTLEANQSNPSTPNDNSNSKLSSDSIKVSTPNSNYRSRSRPSITISNSTISTPPNTPKTPNLSSNETTSTIKSSSSSKKNLKKEQPKIQMETLPIDAYREEILSRIKRERITIIHGETGCGKSSRIPVMLLEDAQEKRRYCKMMVSQPRRIAASSLMKRVRSTLGMQVGLRMGHGIKDESDETNIYFVTTGYLVRLLAFKPNVFQNHTHLIIDEVHERSIDGDVLCYLVKQLLRNHDTIKIILMSATIHTELYSTYFSDVIGRNNMTPLSVGLKRFPIDIKYIEDLKNMKDPTSGIVIKKIIETCKRLRGRGDPGLQFPKDQYIMVRNIIETYTSIGTGVLVFVSGMSDITDLQELLSINKIYDIYAIHSDIPFEEQESAFEPTPPNKIKVVIATNAAESSITLPDVDIVICLGMHKQITYDSTTHRSVLQKNFISKASATQRAGRTGRVRPGQVFRLYTKQLFDSFYQFENSEVLRTPLQETILSIRIMLEESSTFNGVIPVLEELLEPPDTINVENSFQYLYDNGLISSNNDEGILTPTGKLVGLLPVGISLGRLIAYGVQLGIGNDAANLAIALTQPKSPFRIASPIIHTNPDDYNGIVKTIFLSSAKFDQGLYSDPLMLLNLLKEWRTLKTEKEKEHWAFYHGVVLARMRYFDSASNHLCQKLDEIMNSTTIEHDYNNSLTSKNNKKVNNNNNNNNKIEITESQRINFLRVILAWTSEENILRMKPHEYRQPEISKLIITNKSEETLTLDQIDSLFPYDKCLWEINFEGEIIYTLPYKSSAFLEQIGIDHIIELLCSLVLIKFHLVMISVKINLSGKEKVEYLIINNSDTTAIELIETELSSIHSKEISQSYENNFTIYRVEVGESKKHRKILSNLYDSFSSSISLILQSKKDVTIETTNCLFTAGEIQGIFCPGTNNRIQQKEISTPKQVITFYYPDQINKNENENEDVSEDHNMKNSVKDNKNGRLFPLHQDSPLGIQLYQAYLSGYNKTKVLRVKRIAPDVQKIEPVVGSAEWVAQRQKESLKRQQQEDGEQDDIPDDVLVVDSTTPSSTWKMYSSSGRNFISTIMPRFSIPGVVLYCGEKTLFGTAHNCLALGAGGNLIRCEGVTLFPPGCAWLSLALACVGIDSFKFMFNGTFPSYEEIELSKLSLVDIITDILTDSRDGWVNYNPKLVRLLQELFIDWTD